MHSLKFRAWDKENKRFYYDIEEDDFSGFLSNDQFVVEQDAGLKDKNGIEIYEGDIVSCYSLSGEYGALFVVKYGRLPDICGHEYCPCLQGFYLDEIGEYEEVDENGYMEVIGDIHENKELLDDTQAT